MAVDSASARFSIAVITGWRSWVGVTSTEAVPANDTTPTFRVGGSSSMNLVAAALAATRRLGSTSFASIESDTSMAMITVARSRGTCT